jgi:ketosteroid isomerase-like protein
MSQANVEIVQRAWEAQTRHDNESAFRRYAPEVEVQNALGEVYRGADGVRDYFRGFFGAMDDTGAEVEEWIDGGDEVIAVMHTWGRGRRSGVPVEQHEFHVWTVRDNKLERLRVYTHLSDALEAAGLAG